MEYTKNIEDSLQYSLRNVDRFLKDQQQSPGMSNYTMKGYEGKIEDFADGGWGLRNIPWKDIYCD
mgnify:CR=1 FL=1